MIAAQLLGIEQIGLAALLERCFAITIGKEGQKSDWSQRPLSDKQLHYAVNDTRYLEALAERMASELEAKGRLGWHSESCRAMVQASGRDNSRDPEESLASQGRGADDPAAIGLPARVLALARSARPACQSAAIQNFW